MCSFTKILGHGKKETKHYDLHEDIWNRCMEQRRLERIQYEKRKGTKEKKTENTNTEEGPKSAGRFTPSVVSC